MNELPWIQVTPQPVPHDHPDRDDPDSDLDAIRTILHALDGQNTSIYGEVVEEYGAPRVWPTDRAAQLLAVWRNSVHLTALRRRGHR